MVTNLRNSNLELYRIIVMLAIVAHHYVVCSGIWLGGALREQYTEPHALFYWVFGMWGKTGINCFVLITGYFMCTSQISLRKFLKLFLQIEFYNFTISVVLLAVEYEGMSLGLFLQLLLPVTEVASGFTGCFLLFYLTIPFLNVLISGIGRRMHLRLVVLFLFIYTFVLYLPNGIVMMNYVSWFIVLYFIASYVRLYPNAIYKSNHMKIWGWLSLMAILAALSSVIGTCVFKDMFGMNRNPYWLVADANAFLALAVGFTTFMFFKNFRLPQSPLINNIASTTFGVLLIHSNSRPLRHWLWYDLIDCNGHYATTYFFLYALASIIGVFAVCSLIDYVRIQTVEKWIFLYLDRKWLKKA